MFVYKDLNEISQFVYLIFGFRASLLYELCLICFSELDKKTMNDTIVINDYSKYDYSAKVSNMEKKLLLLGLLLSHGMHGYQLNEVLQQNPGTPISLKKSNAYKLLVDMEKDGWVTHIQEQAGNHPQRRVYSVTEAGKNAFYRLLRENLSTHASPEFPSVVGLDFVYMLPAEEAVSLLEERYHVVVEKFQQLDDISVEMRQSHLAIDYLHQHYAKEIEWLTDIISLLKSD